MLIQVTGHGTESDFSMLMHGIRKALLLICGKIWDGKRFSNLLKNAM